MCRLFEAEVFAAVVDEGSLTAAAQRLGVTKSYASNLGSEKIVLDAFGFDFFLEQVDDVKLNLKFHVGLKAG